MYKNSSVLHGHNSSSAQVCFQAGASLLENCPWLKRREPWRLSLRLLHVHVTASSKDAVILHAERQTSKDTSRRQMLPMISAVTFLRTSALLSGISEIFGRDGRA